MKTFIALNTVDAVLTAVGLYGLGATEMNPLARYVFDKAGVVGIPVYKTVWIVVLSLLLRRLPKRFADKAMTVANVVLVLVCICNVLQIKELVSSLVGTHSLPTTCVQ